MNDVNIEVKYMTPSAVMNKTSWCYAVSKEDNSAYGITVPDLPGCFSAADTFEEINSMAEEAIRGHIEALKYTGDPIPVPSSILIHKKNPEFKGCLWNQLDILEKIEVPRPTVVSFSSNLLQIKTPGASLFSRISLCLDNISAKYDFSKYTPVKCHILLKNHDHEIEIPYTPIDNYIPVNNDIKLDAISCRMYMSIGKNNVVPITLVHAYLLFDSVRRKIYFQANYDSIKTMESDSSYPFNGMHCSLEILAAENVSVA